MKTNSSLANSVAKPYRSFISRCRCQGERKPPRKDRCICIHTDDPIEKPDLAIYSQVEQLNNGNVPNWDSPDIVTNFWKPFRLMDEAKVKVRNLSPTVPAINALVHYSTSPFGIGTTQELKLTRVVNIPPGGEIELLFPLDQSTLQGDPRVGVHIQIEHPHDPNMINNEGAQVHDGGFTTESGRNFTVQIPVYNDSNFSREIQLSVMPTDIITSLNPASKVFAAHEQIIATLNIQIPNFLHGTPAAYISRAVTVVGRLTSGELVGGVTRLIRIDD